MGAGSNSYDSASGLMFDASLDNAVYAHDKLQVAALQTLVCIKS